MKSEAARMIPSCGIWRDLGLNGLNDLLSVTCCTVWIRNTGPSSLPSSSIHLSFFLPSIRLSPFPLSSDVYREPRGTFPGPGDTGMGHTELLPLRNPREAGTTDMLMHQWNVMLGSNSGCLNKALWDILDVCCGVVVAKSSWRVYRTFSLEVIIGLRMERSIGILWLKEKIWAEGTACGKQSCGRSSCGQRISRLAALLTHRELSSDQPVLTSNRKYKPSNRSSAIPETIRTESRWCVVSTAWHRLILLACCQPLMAVPLSSTMERAMSV